MKKLESISAFFPAYNDAATISSMVIATLLTLPKVTDDYEVIVVNDGSPDHTGEMLKELARVYPQVRVVTHEKNRGYGGALRSGFAAATKTWIFYTDGDAQYDPRELPRLVEAVTEDCDVVNGYKIARSDPLHRVLIGRLYHTSSGSFSDSACVTWIATTVSCAGPFSTRWISPPPPAPSVSKW